MSKYAAYIDFNDIDKIEIYLDKCKHTAATLRSRLGCDYIINGGLYEYSPLKPCCQMKVNGSVLVNDGYNYISACWNSPTDFNFDIIPKNTSKWKNAIACVCMKHNNVRQSDAIAQADNNRGIGYSTNRTAIGKKDGKLALYVGTDNMTPSGLYNYLSSVGWSDILMLDGGGSTQGYLNGQGTVTSSRYVHNYICVYLKRKTSDTPTDETYIHGQNPYAKPIRALQYGAIGSDVKWAQYQLNVHGIKCDVDGSFGPSMLTAVKSFQRSKNLSVDGSVGPDTRTALSLPKSDATGSTNPYKEPTGAVYSGMTGDSVKWVQYQLVKGGISCNIDGSFGPATVSAVKLFQKANNLDVDGSVGPATRNVLKTI